jgi:hypothetical protein
METTKTQLNLAWIISLLIADIDIKLLKKEDQQTDQDRLFTVAEIRAQILDSGSNLSRILTELGVDIFAQNFQKIKTIRET